MLDFTWNKCARFLRFLIIVACFALLLPSSVFAANDTAATAIPFDASHPSASDSLVGSTGGAYRYYHFSYQGGNAQAMVSLSFQPGYGVVGPQQFGFNVYGPNGLVWVGTPIGTSENVSTVQVPVASSAPFDALIQVFNYSPGVQIPYNIWVSGLTGGSPAPVAATSNTTPNTATVIASTKATFTGTLVGKWGGAFQYYTLSNPGDGTPLAVTLNGSPIYNGQGYAYGFNLYRDDPDGQVVLAASSAPISQDSSTITFAASASQSAPAIYQLQIYNYWPGVPLSFHVNVTGLGGPLPSGTGSHG